MQFKKNILKQAQKEHTQTNIKIHQIEKQITEKLKALSSYQKGESSLRDGSKLRLISPEKKNMIVNYQNEISAIKLESLYDRCIGILE